VLDKIEINKISQVAYVPKDITVSELGRLLSFEGFVCGYSPVRDFQLPLVDCVLQRVPNLYWLKYGGLEDLCVGGVFTTKTNRKIVLKHVPRAAAGSDLKRFFIGSEQQVGNFDEVIMKIFSIPESELWGVVFFDTSAACLNFIRHVYAQGVRPLFMKIAEEGESQGVSRSLNLVKHRNHVVCIKLSGLKGMVHAEKRMIDAYPHIMDIHWANRNAEAEILDETIIEPDALRELFKKTGQLFMDQQSVPNRSEKKLLQFLERNPC